MNFAKCLAKPKTNVTMMATVVSMDREKESNGKWSRQCDLMDEMNVQYRVKILRGSGMSLDETQIRQKLTFNLQAYQSNFDQKTYFSGFWNDREDANAFGPDATLPAGPEPPRIAPQTTQQAVQSAPQAAQSPNASQGQQGSSLPTPNYTQDHAPAGYDGTIQKEEPDWDAIARGKVRNSVICAYIATGKEPIIEQVDYWVQYIMTGHAPVPPAKATDIPDLDPSIQEGAEGENFQGQE